MRPRSSAVCTSSSSSRGPKAPERTSASSRSRASSMPASSASSSRPAWCSTRACAWDPATSTSARRQSNWVDLLSAASAPLGPPANRPPQRLAEDSAIGLEVRRGGQVDPVAELGVARRGQLRGEAVDLDEALGVRLVERVALVVGREVEVVQARVRAAPRDGRAATVQHHAHLARHVALGVVDEDVEGLLERAEPHAVVDQLGPALLDAALEACLLALDRDVLQLLVRRDQGHGAGGLIDLAGLDADEPVLDDV